MVFCIRKFLSYFCLVYSTNEGDLELNYASLDLPENKSDILGVVDRMHEVYYQEFQSVLEEVSDAPEFHTKFQFFTNATLSRCIKLFGTGNFYHFMLVCTLIRELIFTSFDSERCYTFAEIGLQCLSIVYDRCSERPSNDADGYQELATYCRSLDPDHPREQYDPRKPWPLEARFNISRLIINLIDIDEVNYPIANYEQEKINDCLNSIPMEDLDGEVINVSLNGLFESENSSNDCTIVEDRSRTLESIERSNDEVIEASLNGLLESENSSNDCMIVEDRYRTFESTERSNGEVTELSSNGLFKSENSSDDCMIVEDRSRTLECMERSNDEVIEVSSNGLFENENSSDDCMIVEDRLGTLESVERSNAVRKVCPFCRRRCFELVEKFLDSIRI